MIQLCSISTFCALQGGLHMVVHPSSDDGQFPPAQVWDKLPTDLRTRTISLLAQLALNVVLARSHAECSEKEMGDACTAASSQNSCLSS